MDTQVRTVSPNKAKKSIRRAFGKKRPICLNVDFPFRKKRHFNNKNLK